MPRQIHAGDGRKDIEASRIAAKPKETVAVGEVFPSDALERYAELGKRGIGRLCVIGVRF
jgi:hypothetical protein